MSEGRLHITHLLINLIDSISHLTNSSYVMSHVARLILLQVREWSGKSLYINCVLKPNKVLYSPSPPIQYMTVDQN